MRATRGWTVWNKQYAELDVFHRLVGGLRAAQRAGDGVTPEELLQFIETEVERETARLDAKFPEK